MKPKLNISFYVFLVGIFCTSCFTINTMTSGPLDKIQAQTPIDWNDSIKISNVSSFSLNGIIDTQVQFTIFLDKTPYILGYLNGIRIWSLNDGSSRLLVTALKCKGITNMLVTHDETKIIVTKEDASNDKRSIFCVSLKTGKLLWQNDQFKSRTWYYGLGVSADDSLVYLIGENRGSIVNMDTGATLNKQEMILHPLPKLFIQNAVFSHSGRYMAYWVMPNGKFWHYTGSQLHVWDFIKQKEINETFMPGYGVWSVAFSADAQRLFVGNADGILRLWSIAENRIINSWDLVSDPQFRKIQRCIDYLSKPSKSDNLIDANRLWEYPEMRRYQGVIDVRGFSSDGQYALINNHGLSLFDTKTWKCIWTWK